MQEIGRLLFTRKDGESFVVGNDTTITLHRKAPARANVVIKRGDEVRTHNVGDREPIEINEHASMEVSFDYGKGRTSGMRVLVIAPKSVKVLRSELIGRGPR